MEPIDAIQHLSEVIVHHVDRANALIDRSNGVDGDYAMLLIAQAQVHATLALTHATLGN